MGQLRLFFVLALGFTWLLQLPAVVAQAGILDGGVQRYFGLAALAGFGPSIAALVAARAEGAGGVRALLARFVIKGFAGHWYLTALLLFPLLHMVAAGIARLISPDSRVQWAYFPETAQHVVAMVVVSLVEEPGWRGFALPRLSNRFAPLPASLLLGLPWAAWHVMMFALQPMNAWVYGLALLNIVAGSVVFGWLFQRTRGSLTIAVLAHMGAHLSNPARALPDNPHAFAANTAALVVFACLLPWLDRAAFSPSGHLSSVAPFSSSPAAPGKLHRQTRP